MGIGYNGGGKGVIDDMQVVRRTISVARNVYRLCVDIVEL